MTLSTTAKTFSCHIVYDFGGVTKISFLISIQETRLTQYWNNNIVFSITGTSLVAYDAFNDRQNSFMSHCVRFRRCYENTGHQPCLENTCPAFLLRKHMLKNIYEITSFRIKEIDLERNGNFIITRFSCLYSLWVAAGFTRLV